MFNESSEDINKGKETLPTGMGEQLCFALYTASNSMMQLYKKMLEPLGLTYTQYLIMLILWEKDDVIIKHISQILNQKTGALTPVLKRLEKGDLLTRRRSLEDERQVFIQLTEKGKNLKSLAADLHGKFVESCGMTEQETKQLRKNISKLVENVNYSLCNNF